MTPCVCDALRDLVPFVQFKKHEKHEWRIVKPATLLKVRLLHGFFHIFKIVQMVPNRAKGHIL